MRSAGTLAGATLIGILLRTAAASGAAETPPAAADLSLANGRVELTVEIRGGRLAGDRLRFLSAPGNDDTGIATDAGFAVELMYTAWRAPGRVHNADNQISLGSGDFRVAGHRLERGEGVRLLELDLEGEGHSLAARITYRLADGAAWVERRLAVRDREDTGHFLQWIWPLRSLVSTPGEVLKPGGFGMPAALVTAGGGAFFGLEYPAGTNGLAAAGEAHALRAGQERGERLGSEWIESDWAVTGLAADRHVRRAFLDYLDGQRVAPLRPYLLYNTWYDVRSPEYTERPEDVMNEANLRRILGDFERVRETYPSFHLDAFVLDDGWDVYESDWELRAREFPAGLGPFAETLREQGTRLGVWFGPTGGYSFRDKRIDWLAEHGYERVGDQMCVAGERYRKLLLERTVDLVREHGVAYFKWDGVQYACSEPGHGHPVGVYSRRAVMESVAALAAAVRRENPEMFLNITSGTWLSPWWVRIADTIWMQGRDYGYSQVPSISRRDRAMTYRDVVLYEDFRVQGSWFPMANLMTHGIIKGRLQQLGGEAEPLDKFTNNAVLYVARGVAMWELYVSPDLLSDGEWRAIVDAVDWARDRFDVLTSTAMIGGDPGAREPYGYVHFAGRRGIVALRNPFVRPRTIKVELAPAAGLDPAAASLVLDRVYPTRQVSPDLYAAGATVELPLDGYETAVYEVYPLEEAREPLLAGAVFETRDAPEGVREIAVLSSGERVRLLNPERVAAVAVDGREVPPQALTLAASQPSSGTKGTPPVRTRQGLELGFEVADEDVGATLAILFEPAGEAGPGPFAGVTLDARAVVPAVEEQESTWTWVSVEAGPGVHRLAVPLAEPFRGRVSAWLIRRSAPAARSVTFRLTEPAGPGRPLPPRPWPPGEIRSTVALGAIEL